MILRWYFSLHFQRSLIRDKVLCIKDITLILYPKMRLWYFFREKRFLRACIYWFFIACVLPSKFPPFCWNYHVPQIVLLLTIIPPYTTFFRNFLAESFVVSNNMCTFAATYSPRFPLEQRAQGESFLSFCHFQCLAIR